MVTKLSHISQFLISLFAKMMDLPTNYTQNVMLATRVPFIFCSSSSFIFSNQKTHKMQSNRYTQTQLHPNLAPPPPTANPESTTNSKPRIHHHQPSSTTTNGKPRNRQPQPLPPTTLNTTTTSAKKSERIKNPNPPIALNQNHNLHQKIQMNAQNTHNQKFHHSPSLKPQP